jgi:hypothetical protein
MPRKAIRHRIESFFDDSLRMLFLFASACEAAQM